MLSKVKHNVKITILIPFHNHSLSTEQRGERERERELSTRQTTFEQVLVVKNLDTAISADKFLFTGYLKSIQSLMIYKMDDPFHSLNNWDQVYTEPDLFESILSTNSITEVFKYQITNSTS